MSGTRTRINVTSPDGRLEGWFYWESARVFKELAYGVDRTSVNTNSDHHHQTLFRTAKGQWVLSEWSDYQGSDTSYRFVTGERAREWLLLNEEDDAVREYFGELEEEAGPSLGGRPVVGPKVQIRLPQDVLDRVAAYSEDEGVSRAEAVRQLLVAGLDSAQPNAEA